MPVEVTVTGTQRACRSRRNAALYRIVQEALGNVFRHARASKAQVALGFDDGLIRLVIADDSISIAEVEPGRASGMGWATCGGGSKIWAGRST